MGAHVLLIHQAFVAAGEAGGTRHFELFRLLSRRGYRATVVTSTVSYLTGSTSRTASRLVTAEDVDDIRILRVANPIPLHRSFVVRVIAFLAFMGMAVAAACRVRNVSVVMGTSPPIFQAGSAWAVATLRRRPLLLEIRDLWPSFAIDMGVLRNRSLIALARWFEAFLYARATHIVVNSPAYRDYLLGRGVPAAKITLIANGVDVTMFDPADERRDAVRRELGVAGRFAVTYAGALGPANDIETILRAARALAAEPTVQFLLVGDGKDRRRLEAEARTLGLTNVSFLGARAKCDMPAILAASDACVATLRDIPMFRMTYPNKVFDYMAAGRPTILAIDGVIRDVVEDAGAGIAVKPGDAGSLADAVRFLLARPDTARAMGAAARRHVERHFRREHQADQLIEVVERVRGGR